MDHIIKKRIRFSDQDELLLLREVIGQNPFLNLDVWEVIQDHLRSITGKVFSIRSLKDHLDLIIKIWIRDIESLKGRLVKHQLS